MANLLRIRAETNSGDVLSLSVLCHPGPLNTMAYYASHRFDSPDNNFIFFFHSKYCLSQSAVSWKQCQLPSGINSCVIYVLHRRMSWLAKWLTPERLSSTTCLENSAPRLRSSIGLMILPSLWQRFFRCVATRFTTETGLRSLKPAKT